MINLIQIVTILTNDCNYEKLGMMVGGEGEVRVYILMAKTCLCSVYLDLAVQKCLKCSYQSDWISQIM